VTTHQLQRTSTGVGRCCGVLVFLATISLFGSTLCANTINNYNAWRWNGFTSSTLSLVETSSSSVSSTTAASSLTSTTLSGAQLSGVVYYDVDADNVRESSDWAIQFATVQLTKSGSTATSTYTTDKNGDYSFSGLAAGTYTVTLLTTSNTGGTTSAGTLDGASDTKALEYTASISNIIISNTSDVGTNYDFAQYAYPVSLISKRLLMGDGGFTNTNPVPEPGTLALLGIGFASILGYATRRRGLAARQ
jgi:hypothetical protein